MVRAWPRAEATKRARTAKDCMANKRMKGRGGGEEGM
jgi:hypothetical protein